MRQSSGKFFFLTLGCSLLLGAMPSPVLAASPQTSCTGCVLTTNVTGASGGSCPSLLTDIVFSSGDGVCAAAANPPPYCLTEPCSVNGSVTITTTPGQTGVQICFQVTNHLSWDPPQLGVPRCADLDSELADGIYVTTFNEQIPCDSSLSISGKHPCGYSQGLKFTCSKCQ